MSEAALALEVHRAIKGNYPRGNEWPTVAAKLNELWIVVSYKDDWSRPLLYTNTGTGYELASCGADKSCLSGRPGTWISGDYNQDIVIESGRWTQVRGEEAHSDVSVSATGRLKSSQGNSHVELTFTIKSSRSSPLGLRLEAFIVGAAAWKHTGYKPIEVTNGYPFLRWDVVEALPEEGVRFKGEAAITKAPVCFVAVGYDLQREEDNFRDNVSSWCVSNEL